MLEIVLPVVTTTSTSATRKKTVPVSQWGATDCHGPSHPRWQHLICVIYVLELLQMSEAVRSFINSTVDDILMLFKGVTKAL